MAVVLGVPPDLVSLETFKLEEPYVFELLKLMCACSTAQQLSWFSIESSDLLHILRAFKKIQGRIVVSPDGQLTAPTGIRKKHILMIASIIGRCNKKICIGFNVYQPFLEQLGLPKQKIMSKKRIDNSCYPPIVSESVEMELSLFPHAKERAKSVHIIKSASDCVLTWTLENIEKFYFYDFKDIVKLKGVIPEVATAFNYVPPGRKQHIRNILAVGGAIPAANVGGGAAGGGGGAVGGAAGGGGGAVEKDSLIIRTKNISLEAFKPVDKIERAHFIVLDSSRTQVWGFPADQFVGLIKWHLENKGIIQYITSAELAITSPIVGFRHSNIITLPFIVLSNIFKLVDPTYNTKEFASWYNDLRTRYARANPSTFRIISCKSATCKYNAAGHPMIVSGYQCSSAKCFENYDTHGLGNFHKYNCRGCKISSCGLCGNPETDHMGESKVCPKPVSMPKEEVDALRAAGFRLCPGCKIPTEHRGGCDHMECENPICRNHWCWRCNQFLLINPLTGTRYVHDCPVPIEQGHTNAYITAAEADGYQALPAVGVTNPAEYHRLA
jgi:hypothetical protein